MSVCACGQARMRPHVRLRPCMCSCASPHRVCFVRVHVLVEELIPVLEFMLAFSLAHAPVLALTLMFVFVRMVVLALVHVHVPVRSLALVLLLVLGARASACPRTCADACARTWCTEAHAAQGHLASMFRSLRSRFSLCVLRACSEHCVKIERASCFVTAFCTSSRRQMEDLIMSPVGKRSYMRCREDINCMKEPRCATGRPIMIAKRYAPGSGNPSRLPQTNSGSRASP